MAMGEGEGGHTIDNEYNEGNKKVLSWLGLKPTQSLSKAAFVAEPSQERLDMSRGSAWLDRLPGLELLLLTAKSCPTHQLSRGRNKFLFGPKNTPNRDVQKKPEHGLKPAYLRLLKLSRAENGAEPHGASHNITNDSHTVVVGHGVLTMGVEKKRSMSKENMSKQMNWS
ncbi:hypothetical protein BDN72DRAFT_865481 [Pluteus cervinus]|uniref:Uncharacterized protein n=1 Tax=Pluteus cervinus TaxID=181527 RepID=A0ACD2ZZL5_9AGAR|nr:hypothetical protein BDN72DRAFT_865481 [Pluteus cervinus]